MKWDPEGEQAGPAGRPDPPIPYDPGFVWPVGKYRGTAIARLPDSYLRWMAENVQYPLRERARAALAADRARDKAVLAADRELAVPADPGPPAPVREEGSWLRLGSVDGGLWLRRDQVAAVGEQAPDGPGGFRTLVWLAGMGTPFRVRNPAAEVVARLAGPW